MPLVKRAWPPVLSNTQFAAAVSLAICLCVTPVAATMPLCSGPSRTTCVVDGDTVWIEGEKIRLADIDAPEPGGRCVEERVLAARSAGRLAELLSSGTYTITRTGKDRYGRTLAVIIVGRATVGAILVKEGLAREWSGRRENWC